MDALDSVLKIEERLVAKATLANIPIGGTFELTPLCNMNCDMCFIRLSKDEMNNIGRLRTADEWLEIARQMRKAGTLFVLLTGGEPLLYPEFKKLYRGLKDLGMIITINTNGTLITEEIARILGEDKPRRVNITLYGASNVTYSNLCHNPHGFDQTIKGIELLMKYHVDIKLNSSIVPENQHEVQQLQDIADKYHLYMKMDTYMYPGSRERLCKFKQNTRLTAKQAAKKCIEIHQRQMSTDEFKQYKKEMLAYCNVEGISDKKTLNCRAGKSAFWITWYGQMTSCIFLKHIGLDVFEHGFDKCWQYLVEKYKDISLPKSCLSCNKREVCQVCGASVYTETKTMDSKPEYLCEYTNEILKELRSIK